MKNLLTLTAGAFVVVFLLAGTDVWPCRTHAATLLNNRGDKTNLTLGIVQENELFRQKRQSPGEPGRKSPREWYTEEYSLKTRKIFHAHQILYGPLWQLHVKILNPNPQQNENDVVSLDLSKVLYPFTGFKTPQISLPDNLKKGFPGPERFSQMYVMRIEISHQSYSVKCFESDKKVLIALAEYLDGVNSQKSAAKSSGTGRCDCLRIVVKRILCCIENLRNRKTLKSAITSALDYKSSPSTPSASDNQCAVKDSLDKIRKIF
ncbi:uncharacterized protein LOC124204586 isoform X1 [Daphnia pulex]|uniref:uncharacterized protein LOC124204586 isoform X1 n=1 Tax=Daphnia pulex TaxID=6669 RepID=UPI001EDD944D|nr:uncharacterized protein LOC124204586 isoform X1 [Daphnia pulex]